LEKLSWQKLNTFAPGAHLAWKKGVCRGMAAFDHKTTFSLKTGNRPMNFKNLPNFGNPSCYFVSD